MDWLVWITQLVILALLGRLFIKINAIDTKYVALKRHMNNLNIALRVRQSSIAKSSTSQKAPAIDAKPRTVRRDTNDLEPTARVGRAVHRTRRSTRANADDGQLR